MKISFHGAAQTVTGSKHILTLNNGKNILLDCGMFQGMGHETAELNAHFGFDASTIDVLLLSHAHIDHSGLIPKLVKEGFNGVIYCTQATKELAEILLYDSAEIQTYEGNHRHHAPLYNSDDVAACLSQFKVIHFNEWFSLMDGVDVVYTPAGHLIGSAAITIRAKENRRKTTILYGGDVGRYQSVLLKPPAETPQADYIILESTYGDKRHDLTFNTIENIHKWIQKICVQQEGKLVIPAFSVGRTQEVLYALNQLSLEKRLPDISFFIDSPLSLLATQTIKKYTDQFNERLQKVLLVDDDPFEFPGLKYIESVDDSRRLTAYNKPCVIISASGTADAGRVRHHIHSCIGNANCGILMVGYCGAQSLGGQLLSGYQTVDIFNQSCEVIATTGQVQGMSAHGDTDDLLQFISHQPVEKVKGIFLVHGERHVQKTFAEKISLKGYKRIECPAMHEVFELPLKPKRKREHIPTQHTTTVHAVRNNTDIGNRFQK